jgi:hypothetical protein
LELGEWSELGLSRFATARGLAQLDAAGLVSAERRRGRSPVVKIKAVKREPIFAHAPPDLARLMEDEC